MEEKTETHGILVIDDELGPRESLRFLFKDRHEVFCADSVEAGLAFLKVSEPDVIILDIKMPGKTGIEGLREIRAVDPNVSIIMLTGFGSLETAQAAMRLGANDYIKKPFDTKEMRETVESYMDRTRVTRKRAQTTQHLEAINAQFEGELEEMQRLASLGQASSEFVHDLRNLLTVICGYVNLLMDDVRRSVATEEHGTEGALDYLGIISRNAERCREMAMMWKTLGQKDQTRIKPCRVADLMTEVLHTAMPLAEQAHAEICLREGPMDCEVMADSGQLFRALQNVVTNAIQALDGHGRKVDLQWAVNDDKVEILVRDDGCGIDPAHMAQIFSPNFTTKRDSGGMGIGLYLTKKVIETTHDGTISLENGDAGGAVATIHMPLVSAN